MSANIAAIHLVTQTKDIGSPLLAAGMLIFGGKEPHQYFWVVDGWQNWQSTDVLFKYKRDSVELLANSGAEVIPGHLFGTRIAGRLALHQVEAVIWQNCYESHVSHRAYLYAVTDDKTKMYQKGFNFDGETLNAANRFLAEDRMSVVTTTDSVNAGLFYLKKMYIQAKVLLGHDMDSDGAKILKDNAPKLAKVTTPSLPTMPAPKTPPSLPGAPSTPAMPKLPTNILTAPALPPTLPALPGQ